MSKPSLYLPSKPVKYELKRQLIPTDVLIGVREWKAQCKKIKKEHQLKLNMYEFNEIMKFVKESRCKSQN